MTSVFKAGNVALITGGASGIGLALAKKCHGYGMQVAIVDINEEHLELAKRSVGERTKVYKVDVGKLEQWENLKTSIESDLGQINLLALNAGVGGKGTWAEASYFHKIMDTNLFGVIYGISTFLPFMQARASASNPAAIIITGSKQGINNPPGNPAYNSSKAAIKALAEHLSYDLRPTKERPVSVVNVHLLVPGWTYTGMSGGRPGSLEGKPAGAWSPEQVVDFLEEKMYEGKFYVICPDNDVTEDLDRRRVMWSAGDLIEGRPPLTRWREEWKEKAAEGIAKLRI